MLLLEGKTLSGKILAALPGRIARLRALGRAPALAIVNYFSDSPSAVYVRRKTAVCGKLGILVRQIKPEAEAGLPGFLKLLEELAADGSVDALMIERPLPAGLETPAVWDTVPPEKDVDASSSVNTGRLFLSKNTADMERADFFVPCTALAVIKLLGHHNIAVKGRKVAVAGRSAAVGKPIAHMLTGLDATVTLCHTGTPDIAAVFKSSDIVVSAVGRACWIKPWMLSPGAAVIDVGTNMDEAGKMCGDVDFDRVKQSAWALSPVPGGVGPVTLACLLEATVKAAEKRADLSSLKPRLRLSAPGVESAAGRRRLIRKALLPVIPLFLAAAVFAACARAADSASAKASAKTAAGKNPRAQAVSGGSAGSSAKKKKKKPAPEVSEYKFGKAESIPAYKFDRRANPILKKNKPAKKAAKKAPAAEKPPPREENAPPDKGPPIPQKPLPEPPPTLEGAE